MRLLFYLFSAATMALDAVSIGADYAVTQGPNRPVWRYFGYDEPNYTYMKDGRKLLSELAAVSPHTAHVRAYNLLTSRDGIALVQLSW